MVCLQTQLISAILPRKVSALTIDKLNGMKVLNVLIVLGVGFLGTGLSSSHVEDSYLVTGNANETCKFLLEHGFHPPIFPNDFPHPG